MMKLFNRISRNLHLKLLLLDSRLRGNDEIVSL